jgi:hypothetical protein
MAYINQPPDLRVMFNDIYQRLSKLETAQRFTTPNVDFSTNTPTNPRIGDQFFDTDAELIKYWNGTQFVEVADNLYGTSIITLPTTIQSVNNNMVYTGNPCLIEVQRIGKMITANALINFTNVTNFGTGQIYINIPVGIPTRAHDLQAGGFLLDGGSYYTIFATLGASATKMYLWHPTSNGGSDTVTHNKPTTLDTTSVINITGVALLA